MIVFVCVSVVSIYGPQLGTRMFGVVCLPVMLSQQLHLADATSQAKSRVSAACKGSVLQRGGGEWVNR